MNYSGRFPPLQIMPPCPIRQRRVGQRRAWSMRLHYQDHTRHGLRWRCSPKNKSVCWRHLRSLPSRPRQAAHAGQVRLPEQWSVSPCWLLQWRVDEGTKRWDRESTIPLRTVPWSKNMCFFFRGDRHDGRWKIRRHQTLSLRWWDCSGCPLVPGWRVLDKAQDWLRCPRRTALHYRERSWRL